MTVIEHRWSPDIGPASTRQHRPEPASSLTRDRLASGDGQHSRDVRFAPTSRHPQAVPACRLSANRRHVRRFAPKFCTGEPLELLDRISVAEFLTSAPDAGSGLRRRLRPEVSKNSSTALSSNEGELVRPITTCAPARLRMRHVLDSENGPDTDVGLVERRAGDEGFDGH